MIATTDLLQQGIAAAQAGKRAEARALLMRALEENEHDEQAWLWLSGVLDTPEEMRQCLTNVLHLNPANLKAQQGLAWIDQRYGSRPAPAPQPLPDADAYTHPALRAIEPAPQPAEEISPAPPASTVPAATQLGYRSLHEHPVGASPAPAAELPCQWCGLPTQLRMKRCPHCHKSLMFRLPPDEDKKSAAMTFLSLCWFVPVVIAIISTIISFVITLSQSAGEGGISGIGVVIGLFALILVVLFLLLICSPFLVFARALYKCKRWAYILEWVFTAMEIVVSVVLVVLYLRGFSHLLRPGERIPPNAQILFGPYAGLIIVGALVWRVFIAGILWVGYKAVYGRKVRFIPHVEISYNNYNNGLDYRKRGMWYMAVQEWEAVVMKDTRDVQALHTLGLGYAQIREFGRAREMLDHAIKLEPTNSQLRDSRAFLEQVAGKA